MGAQRLGALGNKSILGVLMGGITLWLKCMRHGCQSWPSHWLWQSWWPGRLCCIRSMGLSFQCKTQTLRNSQMWNDSTLKLLSPTAPLGKCPINIKSCCQFSLSWLGAQLQEEVAGGPDVADTCVSLSSHSSTWRSRCRRVVGAWWGAQWTASSQRGQHGHSAPTHVALAVSPLVSHFPHPPQQSYADGTSSPRRALSRGGRVQGSHRGPEVLGFLNKAGYLHNLKWKMQLRKQVDRCLELFY